MTTYMIYCVHYIRLWHLEKKMALHLAPRTDLAVQLYTRFSPYRSIYIWIYVMLHQMVDQSKA